jgi:hypothetical protein
MKIINIKRLAMATAMLLAVNMNANAQDGLKNTVQQQTAKAQVDLARQRDIERIQSERRQARAAQEKAKQDACGQTGTLPQANLKNGDVDFFYDNGKRMGIYHSKTKIWEKFLCDKSVTPNKWFSRNHIFKDDNTVEYEDGTKVGIFNSDGTITSGFTRGISLDKDNFVFWNGKKIGSVSELGEYYLGNTFIGYSYGYIEPKIAAYIMFCTYLTEDLITNELARQTSEKIKPGSLNAQYHSAALASIQKRIQGVQDVVITSNDWRIIRDDLGNIISRACDGWYFIKNGTGRRAISYCWKQSYLGGGKYDSLEASAANGFDPIDLE